MFSTSSLVLHYHPRTLNSLLPSRLLSLFYVVLHKAKPHSGIPGSERADSNANKGLTMRTPIGRFPSFPFSPLPPPLSTHQSSSPPDSTTFTIIRSISSAAGSSFPVKSIPSRRPYTSHSMMNLTALSSLRWLQKGLLSRIKIQKKTKTNQLKNTKSELQGLENTTGWLCIYFAIWFLLFKMNMGLALWLIFEFVFFLVFCIF